MSTPRRIVVTAIATALILPLSATAADEKPADPIQKTPPAPAAKKGTRHDHSEMNKQGAPSAVPDQSAPPKKQGHKHSDWK